jgi:hypothetical protein
LGCEKFSPWSECGQDPAPKKVLALLDEFSPSVIVIRERTMKGNIGRSRVLSAVLGQAKSQSMSVRFVSPKTIAKAFVGSDSNKHEVASALALQFSVLLSKLPPRRKCWQSEDYRMSIFDAAAAGVAYFAHRTSVV